MKLTDKTLTHIEPMVLSPIALLLFGHEIMQKRNEALLKAQSRMNEAWERYQYKVRSNNWRKMHHYPMRRRH